MEIKNYPIKIEEPIEEKVEEKKPVTKSKKKRPLIEEIEE